MRLGAAWLVALLLLAGCSDPAPRPPANPASMATLSGVVFDEAVRPLAGATVRIAALGHSMSTGPDGAFAFDALEAGTYLVEAAKEGYVTAQASSEVRLNGGPHFVEIALSAVPSQQPYVESHSLSGYLSLGAALGTTSVGTTAYGPIAQALGDRSVWTLQFNSVPDWMQAELVWDQTQPVGGELIWEMTEGGGSNNTAVGYSETASSPALAYWNTSVAADHGKTLLDPARGVAYRFFGGPHPALKPGDACPALPQVGNPCMFGYGATVQQKADAYVHNFFNFVPDEGWRFTEHGDPVVPR